MLHQPQHEWAPGKAASTPFHPLPSTSLPFTAETTTRKFSWSGGLDQELLGDTGKGNLYLVSAGCGSFSPQLQVMFSSPGLGWDTHASQLLAMPLFCSVRTIPQIIHKEQLRLTALESGKSKVRVPSDLVSSEGYFLLPRWRLRCSHPLQRMLYSPMAEGRG